MTAGLSTSSNRSPSARPEMAHISGSNDPRTAISQLHDPCFSSRDDLLCTLLLRQYAPVAPSPLNPDTKRGRPLHRPRKAPPPVRKPPEVSPTLRLLRRKAAIAYKRSTEQPLHLIRRARSTFIVEEASETPAAVADAINTVEEEESLPAAFIVESGPLIQIVHFECRRHRRTDDPEKQIQPDRSLFQRWQGSRQNVQLFFTMCLMSSCLTFFSVVALELIKRGPLLTS